MSARRRRPCFALRCGPGCSCYRRRSLILPSRFLIHLLCFHFRNKFLLLFNFRVSFFILYRAHLVTSQLITLLRSASLSRSIYLALSHFLYIRPSHSEARPLLMPLPLFLSLPLLLLLPLLGAASAAFT